MIEYINTKDLVPNEHNPRTINKTQFDKLCNNIKNDPDFFEMRPILAYQDTAGLLIVYAGNQRLQAAKKLKMDKVPVIVCEYNEELIKKRIVLDNIHNGHNDFDLLASLYDPGDLLELGMKEEDFSFLDDESDDPGEKKDKKKKEKLCPKCGYDIKK